jgi:hypothetical protein
MDKPDLNVDIALTEPVNLTFSLKYLINFCKATGLCGQVNLCLSNEVPLLVEYKLPNSSFLRFYLAPKVRDQLTIYDCFPLIRASRSATRSKYHGSQIWDNVWNVGMSGPHSGERHLMSTLFTSMMDFEHGQQIEKGVWILIEACSFFTPCLIPTGFSCPDPSNPRYLCHYERGAKPPRFRR